MEITSLINEELIVLDLEASNQLEVIEHLASLLEKQERIESKSAFIQGVLDREAEFTTGFGNGIAIPHCKNSTVKKASIVIGRTIKGIDWNSLDGLEVSFVIMLAIPSSEGGTTHLQILSTLSSKLIDPDFRSRLMNAKDKQEILKLLEECVTDKTI
ncbi:MULTISPECIES: fructose PTS transporter subunit IIA [Parageobacillus]|uniref:PTS mannose transporter subunit IIAB n=1 Tax=Parageobacillus thermoglucosidasius TaxID=1426 RepID=A0A1B7KS82_PARTM|nr:MULTISPECIES: fructose PTS transporter subunit IIA [Parageobacillus]OAT72942.1 PTS mannose transporter subunit IIAB [Parageobacillus thermoglucosidasius]BDG47231.1 PTS fructose transporter subunit IIA [Parageobacillus sp. KH3-4]